MEGRDMDVKEEVDGITVSTVELPIAHGSYTYETCLFWSDGSYVIDRYATKTAAEQGHDEIREAIERGDYEIKDDNRVKVKRDV